MALLVEGSEGLIQVGPSSAPTTVGYVTQFSVECTREMAKRGPYVGDNTYRKTQNAKESKGSLTADTPKGRDSGQSALIAAFEAGTPIRLLLRGGATTDEYTYTCANAGLSNIKWGKESASGNTVELSWEDMDGYTLVPST